MIQQGNLLREVIVNISPKHLNLDVEKLENRWYELLLFIEEYKKDVQYSKEQWVCFSYEAEEVENSLMKRETEINESTLLSPFGEESVENEIEKQKVCMC